MSAFVLISYLLGCFIPFFATTIYDANSEKRQTLINICVLGKFVRPLVRMESIPFSHVLTTIADSEDFLSSYRSHIFTKLNTVDQSFGMRKKTSVRSVLKSGREVPCLFCTRPFNGVFRPANTRSKTKEKKLYIYI